MNEKKQILTKGRARKPGIDSSNSIKVLVQLTRGKSLRRGNHVSQGTALF